MRLGVVLLVLVACCAVPWSAAAATRVIRPEAAVVTGPVNAGPDVVWVESRPNRRLVVRRDGPTGSADIASLPAYHREGYPVPDSEVSVAASSSYFALGAQGDKCQPDKGCASGSVTAFSEIVAGPLAGPLRSVVRCDAGRGYECRYPRRGVCPFADRLQVSDSLLGVDDLCAGGFVVRDLAAAGDPAPVLVTRFGPSGSRQTTRIAGPYAAVLDHPSFVFTPSTLTVFDRRTGDQVYRLDVQTSDYQQQFDMQSDGSVAVITSNWSRTSGCQTCPTGVAWASVAAPSLHPIPGLGLWDRATLRFSANRVALQGSIRGGTFAIYTLDGTKIADSGPIFGLGPWDFDGRTLAWWAVPCAPSSIGVWEISTPAPPFQGAHCEHVGLITKRLHINTRTRVYSITMQCEPTTPAGCLAAGVLDSHPAINLMPLARLLSRPLGPGARYTWRGRLSRRQIQLLRRRHIRTATVSVDAYARSGQLLPLRLG